MIRWQMPILAALTLVVAGCPTNGPPSSNGDALSTDFEFTDLSGEFVLGAAPRRVTFRNGEARTVGVESLYHSGHNAWMISPGETGDILFETPTGELVFYVRDQTASVGGVVTLFDEDGQVLAVIASTNSDWTRVVVPGDVIGDPPVSRITFQNNGDSGFAALDDFRCCADIDDMVAPQPLADPIPGGINPSSVKLRLTTIAEGLVAPNWGVSPPGRPDRLAVTDQSGVLWMIELASGERSTFLDLSERLVSLGISGPGSFDERGLLGVAFASDYAASGLLYTYSSEPLAGPADFSTIPPGEAANHQSVIREWRVPDPMEEDSTVDPNSVREVLRIDQPQFNHNGGGLNFGPHGRLYVSLGDGGRADDQGLGHGEIGNGQDASNILGTLLRIDPLGDNSANGRYGIPPDNPFVGDAGKLDEIFAFGFRNPFRFSFDSTSGDLWLADVGQNDIEEINLVVPGGNYGWNLKEGSFFFVTNGDEPGFVTNVTPAGIPGDLVDPVAEYDHDEGTAVIGGFVYRGAAIPALQGHYVFGELSGRLFHLDEDHSILEFSFADREQLGLSVLGFGQDESGELYLMANTTTTPFGTTGVVLRLDPAE